jgi:hypothetical protein
MKGEGTVETSMCSKTFAVRLVHCTNHMEMNSITTDFESLTNFIELDVLETGDQGVITFRV